MPRRPKPVDPVQREGSQYPLIPVKLLLQHKFEAVEWAKDIKVPVFIFHGDKDEVIPFELGKEQSLHFSKNLVTFWDVTGAHHNDLSVVAGREKWARIRTFLK